MKDRYIPGTLTTLAIKEVDSYKGLPFPLDLDAQKRLLELIYNRKSGIITRQELIDVLYTTQDARKSTIIRCRP
jgi:hypothetical protein